MKEIKINKKDFDELKFDVKINTENLLPDHKGDNPDECLRCKQESSDF